MATKVKSHAKASENGIPNRIKGHVPTWKMPELEQPWPFEITIEPTTGWGVSVGDIGPPLASQMLAHNAGNQRNRKPYYIKRLSADMKDGKWTLTPEAVIFNAKGDLIDGQNRLNCIVETGCKVRMMVWFGAGGKKEMTNLNTGSGRNVVDTSKVLGVDGITTNKCATLRAFLAGPGPLPAGLSNNSVLELLKEYAPMLDFVHGINYGQMKKLFTQGVRAAVGRAFYHCPPTKLNRFVELFCDVQSATETGDKAPVLLRAFQVNNSGGGGQGHRTEIYKKSQRAIMAFVNGEKLNKLYPADEDLYPLPTANQMKAREKVSA